MFESRIIAFGMSPRSSAVEHFLGKGEVTGSSPVAGSSCCFYSMSARSVAPTVEQQSPKLRVGGSNPSWPANLTVFITIDLRL